MVTILKHSETKTYLSLARHSARISKEEECQDEENSTRCTVQHSTALYSTVQCTALNKYLVRGSSSVSMPPAPQMWTTCCLSLSTADGAVSARWISATKTLSTGHCLTPGKGQNQLFSFLVPYHLKTTQKKT